MHYSLVVMLNDDTYEVKNYLNKQGFEHLNEKKLKDIVEFTNTFEHEQELISYLIDEDILPPKYFKGNANITYWKGKNTAPKVLQYGVSFKEDKKFFDTIFLKHYYCDNLTNIKFMSSFINKYYKYLKDVNIFSETINNINYNYAYFMKYHNLPDTASESMSKFIEIYCSKKSKEGFYKADFTRIRDLAMFAINYERENIRIPIDRPNNTVEEIEMFLSHYNLLITNNTLSEEEYLAYNNAISSLEKELDYTRKLTRNRSNKK